MDDRPPGVPGFSLAVAWSGREEEPLPRALLVSPSRSARVEARKFWSHAVIGAEELGRLLDALRAGGCPERPGAYRGDETGYYVYLEEEGRARHWHLGATSRTLATLRRMENGLEETHRAPLRQIVERFAAELPD